MACDQRLKNIHQKLLMDISDYVTPNGPVHESITTMIKVHVPPGKVEGKSLIKQFEELARKGKLKPGKYDILEEICRRSGNEDLVDLINNAKEEINKVQTTSQEPGPSTSNNIVVTSTNYNKRSAQDIVGLDMDKYYPKGGKRGLMLILNFISKQKEPDDDIRYLKQFFGGTLDYSIYEPINGADNLTTEQLNDYLNEVKAIMNADSGQQYHSFFCVILGHGNEHGIVTRDGYKDPETIRKEFSNQYIQAFCGRPKIFLIRACRGKENQMGFGTTLGAETGTIEQLHKPNLMVHLPTDADTLLEFSTTPGYISYRHPGIREYVRVFEQNYRNEHLEEMLITIRYNIATKLESAEGYKEMPCVWTTLTRRLML
ncbi:Caspase 8 [Mactra antiquata]